MHEMRESRYTRASFALGRIQTAAPKTRAAKLIYAKFQQAVADVVLAREGNGVEGLLSGLIYLSAPTIHDLSLLGIETEWAIEQLFKAKVFA